MTSVAAFLIAVLAGAFGSVLGIGGGLFIIPSLTLFLHVELKTAIAASVVAVIATSLGGGHVYVRRQLANVRLGLLLALATAPTAVVGALLATRANARLLAAIFAVVLGASAYRMLTAALGPTQEGAGIRQGRASRIDFRGRYADDDSAAATYAVQHVPLGIVASTAAGMVSGLLGVGGGIVQVPVMHLIMGVPVKVATTTSTYIIGITAMAAAFVYYNHRPSYVDPALAVPVTLGVFLGSSAGSAFLTRVSGRALRTVFIAVLLAYTIQMALRALGIIG
jgi:uncharacterized membrane protein YfcA